jgi:aldehyde oxidoreductase
VTGAANRPGVESGGPDRSISLTVNGATVALAVGEDETLLDVLRERLGLVGAKNGCGRGHCGACTVLVDGRARRACVVKAATLEGAVVLTIEGLGAMGAADAGAAAAAGGRSLLHPIQQAFVEADAVQCGFCTPGMIMSTAALLAAHPDPTEAQLREAFRHNLCRCTGYGSIRRAVRLAAGYMRGEGGTAGAAGAAAAGPATSDHTGRVGARDRVLGRPIFAADLAVPRAAAHGGVACGSVAYGKLLLSAYPHAEVLAVDTSAAARRPGVLAVLTAADIPGRNAFGLLTPHQPVLVGPGGRVRHLGDAVAVVFAETPWLAADALADVKVEYRPLPGVFSPEDAMAEGAPLLHESEPPTLPPNVLHRVEVRKGDVAAGFARAHVTIEGEYRTPAVEHAYLEPEAAVAAPAPDGGVTVWTGSQGSHAFRAMIAASLALPDEKVRVIYTPCGGAFGGKEEPTLQIHCALGAMKLGRPVKMTLTREESIRMSTKRHAERIHMRHGADRDGRLVAVEARVVADTGAYASLGRPVVFRSAVVAAGPYEVPNVSSVAVGVYTNNPVAGAFRGFGSTQVAFAAEVQMDKLARALGLDPIDLRRRNALAEGKETITGQLLGPGVGYLQTLDAVEARLADLRATSATSPRPAWKIGIGVASAYKNVGIGTGKADGAGAVVELAPGGRVVVRVGATDMGQGSDTVMARLASQVTGIPLREIDVVSSDTALCPDGEETTASRQTYITGNAVLRAAAAFKEKLDAYVREAPQVAGPADGVRVAGPAGAVAAEPLALAEVYERAARAGRAIAGESFYVAPETFALREPADRDPVADARLWDVHFAYCFGTQAAAVAVDETSGEVTVLKVVAAHDAGRVIFDTGFRGQIEGGIVMGLGYALSEEVRLDRGRITNDNLLALGVPRFRDAPEMVVAAVESPDPGGPLGAKGVGELAINPTAPAIINAIHDAVGVWIDELPATPEKVRAALAAAAKGGGRSCS